MQRRPLLRLLGGGAMLAGASGALTACSTAVPAEAVAAWRPAATPPAGADVRLWLLSYAVLAPHSHNLQSWLVDLREPDAITLYCDRTRLLPETDPQARQIMMSQGTFVELLDLAARQVGLRLWVTLFPHGEFDPAVPAGAAATPRATAHIRLVRDANVQADPLFAAITQRHTNRRPYADRAPPPQAVAALQQAAQQALAAPALRTGVTAPGEAALQEHRRIAREAWRIELTTPRTMLESLRVLRVGPEEIARHRDGITVNDRLPRALAALGLFNRSEAPGPDDMATRQQIDQFGAAMAATPAFFWMVTQHNDRATQVQAGRAYVRAQLAAAAAGLSMQPLQQALQEYPEQAVPYAQIHRLLGAEPGHQTVQMWARLGYGPVIEPAPRRGVPAHLMAA